MARALRGDLPSRRDRRACAGSDVTPLPWVAFDLALAVCVYAYVGYPAALKAWSLFRRAPRPTQLPSDWPHISIALPVHNEAEVVGDTLQGLLALDYPADRRQILVVSDASTDGTDEVVSRFASRGVELLRLPERQGKTAAENAARRHLTGEIIINTDASVRVHPQAVKHLVAAFGDPSVGGASGCLYAIRADLHMGHVPDGLSRDFAAALTARSHGRRAVSVPAAVCFVPRAASLRQEYRRKVRTVTRGLFTLAYKRALLNPRRYGPFAWMLFSHKVCRWLVPWALLVLLAALAGLAFVSGWARAALAAAGAIVALGVVGWLWPEGKKMPRVLALPAFVAAGNAAVLHAWLRVLTGRLAPVWEPTR